MARETLEWKAAAYAKTMEKADLKERIAELEADLKQHAELNIAEHKFMLQYRAERDDYKQAAQVEAGLRRELKAERDAIEVATIERFLAICHAYLPDPVIGALRALAKPAANV
jgi:allophanate hydrolase subunit 1